MTQIVCDRCKKECTGHYYTITPAACGGGSAAAAYNIAKAMAVINGEKHYCPDCTKKVENFLKGECDI